MSAGYSAVEALRTLTCGASQEPMREAARAVDAWEDASGWDAGAPGQTPKTWLLLVAKHGYLNEFLSLRDRWNCWKEAQRLGAAIIAAGCA